MQISNDIKPRNMFFAISGKRFSGKDYFSTVFEKKLTSLMPLANVKILRLADELKKLFAENFDLDYQKLLLSRAYKETHREKMTSFYFKSIQEDYLIWGKKIIDSIKNCKSEEKLNIFILADLRHKFEVKFFKEELKNLGFKMIFIRIESSDEIKEKRGWKFIEEIDENITEKDLDDFLQWDFVLENKDPGSHSLLFFIKEKILKLFFS